MSVVISTGKDDKAKSKGKVSKEDVGVSSTLLRLT